MTPLLLLLACTAPESAPAADASCGEGERLDDAGVCVPAACGAAEFAMEDADAYLRDGDDLAAAVASLDGGTIALAAGTYGAAFEFGKEADGVHIVGRCRELVTLDASGGEKDAGAITIASRAGHTFALSGLTLTGSRGTGVQVDSGTLTMSGVDVLASTGVGMYINHAGTVTVQDVRIADTRASKAGFGDGIDMADESALDGFGLVLDNNVAAGLLAAKATISLQNLTISNTQTAPDGQFGVGLSAYGGADVTLANSTITKNVSAGILLDGAETNAMLTDVAISDTQFSAAVDQSVGLYLTDAAATVSRLHLSGNSEHGVVVEGGIIDITDVTITGGGFAKNTDPFAIAVLSGGTVRARGVIVSAEGGIGFAAWGGAQMTVDGCAVSDGVSIVENVPSRGAEFDEGAIVSLANCTFSRATEVGVFAHGAGTDVMLDHVTILDPQPRPWDGIGGIGLLVSDGAHVTASDLVLRGTRDYAIAAAGADAVADVSGLSVSHSQLDGDGQGGMGLSASEGGTLTVAHGALTDLLRFGFQATTGGHVELSDTVLTHVRPDGDVNSGGGGLVTEGGGLILRRVRLEDLVSVALVMGGTDSTIEAEDVVIADVAISPYGTGNGIEATGGSALAARRVDISGVRGAGVAVFGAGTTATLEDLAIRDVEGQASGVSGALTVAAGARVSARNIDISDVTGIGAEITGDGTAAAIDGLTVGAVSLSPLYSDAFGIVTQLNASSELSHVLVTGIEGGGMVALDGGEVSCAACEISGNASVGVGALDGLLRLSDTEIRDTRAGRGLAGGIGILARSIFGTGAVEASRVVVSGNALAAVWVDAAASVVVRDSVLTGSTGVAVREGLYAHGNAVFARGVDGETRTLSLTGTTVTGASVGVLLEDATAEIAGARWTGNSVDVATQQCGTLPAPADLTGAITELCLTNERLTFPMDYDVFLPEPAASSQ